MKRLSTSWGCSNEQPHQRGSEHPAGLPRQPLEALLENCTEQLVQEYKFLAAKDLRVVELVRDALHRGVELANTRLGDLF
jgi:hypothetical protein